MNVQFLTEEIIPQREKEIEEGKNLGARYPIYVVLDQESRIASGHSDYTNTTTHKDDDMEHMWVDDVLDGEDKELKESPEGMEKPEPVTQFYIDIFEAFFLTRKAADEYMEYQGHNLSERAYVYVFFAGYRNQEMEKLFRK